MSLLLHNLIVSSRPRISLHFIHPHFRNPTFSFPLPSRTLLHSHPTNFPINLKPFFVCRLPTKALKSNGFGQSQSGCRPDVFGLDAFLSVAELLCLASSTVISILVAVNSVFPGFQKPVLDWVGSKILVWQCVLLVGGVVMGSLIRRRQSRRVSVDFSNSMGSGLNLFDRIDKLEEDLRSYAAIVRALSRQLEKLSIRFRVTRKSLKEPIAETAALAQKNSEATRALAMQEDILARELAEIQKVLLAMQEQQHKQLELIIAIGKAGKFWVAKKDVSEDLNNLESSSNSQDDAPRMVTDEILAGKKEATVDSV